MSRRDPFTPGQGFLDDTTNHPRVSSSSKSKTKLSFTQPKLFGMHKAPLITPRLQQHQVRRRNSSTPITSGSSNRKKIVLQQAQLQTRPFNNKKIKRDVFDDDDESEDEQRRDEEVENDDDDDATAGPNSSHSTRRLRRQLDHVDVHSFNSKSRKNKINLSRVPSSSSNMLTSKTNNLGRSILNPSQPVRGPRLTFGEEDHDDEDDDDDDMMLSNEIERRRKNRVWKGGRGELELVPLKDWEADQDRSSSSSSTLMGKKRALELSFDHASSNTNTNSLSARSSDAVQSQLVKKRSRVSSGGSHSHWRDQNEAPSLQKSKSTFSQRQGFDHSSSRQSLRPAGSQPRHLSTTPFSEPEPDTEVDEAEEMLTPPLSLQDESQQPSFVDSSPSGSSDAGEYLQLQLVVEAGKGSIMDSLDDMGDCHFLVGDSDEEEVLDEKRLDFEAHRLGQGGADDSGFVEYNSDDDLEHHDDDDDDGDKKSSQGSFHSSNSMDLDHGSEQILVLPSSQSDEVEGQVENDLFVAQDHDVATPSTKSLGRTLLGRSDSSILMPPPPVPKRTDRKYKADAVIDMPTKENVPISRPEEGEESYEAIETQWPESFSSEQRTTLITPVRIDSNVYSIKSSTPIRPSNPPAMAPPKSTWNSIELAWSGARPLTPPRPLSPRQAKLSEFFNKPDAQPQSFERDCLDLGGENEGKGLEMDDEETMIEDSQPSEIALSKDWGLQMEKAFQLAFETTRLQSTAAVRQIVRGRNEPRERFERSSSLDVVQEEDEEGVAFRRDEEDDDVENDDEEERIPTSDQEDSPWSPLGTPMKLRFPGFKGIKMSNCKTGVSKLNFGKLEIDGGSSEVEEAVRIDSPEVVDGRQDVGEFENGVETGEDQYEEEEDGTNDEAFTLPPLPSFPPSSQRTCSILGGEEERVEGEETQWESYWTMEEREVSPFQELLDDEDDEFGEQMNE